MDSLKSIQNYIDKILSQPLGIKVLLLDKETTTIISQATTQSHLLQHEIYLTDSITNQQRQPIHHLKCICFLRPSSESLKAIQLELRNPRYKEYWLYFSNILKKSEIELLAEADERELVREVQVSCSLSQSSVNIYTSYFLSSGILCRLCSHHLISFLTKPTTIQQHHFTLTAPLWRLNQLLEHLHWCIRTSSPMSRRPMSQSQEETRYQVPQNEQDGQKIGPGITRKTSDP
ncbi:hypothetical protein VP01_3647g4 [Puccinia sorghi]|uniref:Uncharacterized protein n=1 Tax=Puccinia sorghi TaxID=27349 RepID=A0A0L6UWG0_9BASI|nr:hypothetical protein VP01_3647g4 [Puccinia sorghi]